MAGSASVEGAEAPRGELRVDLSTIGGLFYLESTVNCGQAFRWRAGEQGWWVGIIGDRVVWVRQEGETLLARTSLSEGELRSYFRLDDDLEAIYRSFPPDPQLQAAVARYRGMRLLRQDPWECAISFTCATFCHVARISLMVEALCRAYGEPIEQGQYGFPRPGKLASATEGQLRALGLGFRAPNVLDLARRVAEGQLDLKELRAKPYQEARARLKEVRGIGDKVADCVALFSLDHLNAVPVDVWMARVLRTRAPQLRSYEELAGFARTLWSPYAGYAQQYLFHQARMDSGRIACRKGHER